jgi:isoleucyl-tRNA synthetase
LGKNGDNDTRRALAVLFNVLLVLCKTMAPFTPFFVEKIYQNLRRCLPDQGNAEPSVHFCMFPEAAADALDARVETSVVRMQAVIEIGRQIRERNNKSLKTPLKCMIVVHTDGRAANTTTFLYLHAACFCIALHRCVLFLHTSSHCPHIFTRIFTNDEHSFVVPSYHTAIS